ncbi:hypothetical protein G3I59_01775 [Amycolatopsis rubida]|uniref:Uncharacterized protein n=1 Tax=Amycolatopsis rubida TaxID=112413 RepID=A0ABX0BI26_9PSEU|nr:MULTISPECIES: hypothetical protein [Amycolatopsis]MYW89392.1 hypothetical protein [Amycolatopsis rubida]NEC54369.1 hypothetical protein [Amycolatopsis rubida]OAP21379.1 hypothetical protein A4R44_07897 [Amycolatopsis sp. M39]
MRCAITEIVDADVPVPTAYDQRTRFEPFPGLTRFGEQHPDERIAWHSGSGPDHARVIAFHRAGDPVEQRGCETGSWRGDVERPS